MAEPKASKVRKGLIDPLIGAAVLFFFLMAVVFASAPAINAGPATLAGLLLLIGLAGVSFLGLFVLRAGVDPQAESEPGAERFISALAEPAAVAAPDGRIVAANAAWREAVGAAPRLPKGGT
ncbi:MAG: cell cycle histidine kinase CckA, partial [Phenylobacterium sp.]